MRTVKNKNELIKNFEILDSYLKSKKDPEYSYALNLVEKGTCFIAIEIDENNYKFYPSRFVGYFENNMDKHENNFNKDGRITNSAIILDFQYRKYCETLGFVAREKGSFGVKRKFWNFD